MVYEQIVQVRSTYSAPNGAVTVRAFGVEAHAQTFGNDTPLHREVVVGIERGALVGTPRDGAVVDDDIVAETAAESVGTVGFIGRERPVSHAETHVAYDDIATRNRYGISGQTDTVARGTLSGDGNITVSDIQAAVELYGTRYFEQYRYFGKVGYTVTQGSRRIGVFERGYIVDLPSASSRCVTTVAIGTRESGNLGRSRNRPCEGDK